VVHTNKPTKVLISYRGLIHALIVLSLTLANNTRILNEFVCHTQSKPISRSYSH